MADSQAPPAASTAAPAAPSPAAPAPAAPLAGQPAPVNNPPTATTSSQPVRSFLPGAPLSSAEKSLFPSAMPGNRSLPALPGFGSPAPAAASPAGGATPSNGTATGTAGSPAPLSAGSPPYSAGLSAPASRIGQTGRSPSATSPYAPHAPSKSPSVPPSAYPGHGATPTPPIIPPPAAGRSPATSPNPPRSTAVPVRPQQSPPPPPSSQAAAAAAAAGPAGASSRGNPMSVSSMLSGPSRDRPVAAYSPTAAPTSGGATPGTLAAPVVSATPTAPTPQSGGSAPPAPTPKSAGTPQPPVMPPSQQGVPKPPASAPASATAATSAATPSASMPGGPERSSYPPLPSAYARESPYAPSPGGAPVTSSRPSGQQLPSSGGAGYQHSTWSSASAALAHAQAQQQQAKDSLFPAAGGSAGQTPSPGGAARPPSTSGPGPYGPSSTARTASGLQNGAPAAPTAASTGANGTSAGGSFAWQAQAAQQAQQVQRERERESDASKSASASASATATTSTMQSRPGQIGQPSQPSQQQQQQSSTASYGAVRGNSAGTTPPAPLSNGVSATVPTGHKRRRSDLPATAAAPAAAEQQAVETPPAPPPAAPAPPLFTYADQRRACIRPPMIEVVNEAVDAWERQHRQDGEKKSAERPFCGRVVYDALTPPARLLDGDVLASGVGGYVEVLIPTTWIAGPSPSSMGAQAEQIRSSCSVTPRHLPPVAFSVGPPASYAGAPLPQTSPSTPLALPAHLADLPGFRKRQVWGTDVYTDDSDILALLVHSGWLRVTRRERKRRAGEKGAGADAIRRARIEGEERIETAATSNAEGDTTTTADAQAIKVTLGVVPPLVRYQGIERQGVRSRSWGNGHDGVSLRVEHVELLQELPAVRPPRLRKSVAAEFAHQLAAWDERLLVSESSDADQLKTLKRREPLVSMRPPKRYHLDPPSPAEGAAAAQAEPILVSDTFVLPLGEGAGRFVDAEEANASADEDGLEPSDAMEVEVE